ncbi:MAG: YitT family protein [Anaerolineales bacterium]|nr:YitT family protein [Anaerolineales bacterium]
MTILPGTSGYTGAARPVLYVVVTRSEVTQLKALVHDSGAQAFMVVGAAHEALGEGFRPFFTSPPERSPLSPATSGRGDR